MERKQHELVIIGAGPAGYVAAIRAAQLGLDTACVEREQALGGTCLRVGCIPSKALLESSYLYHQAQHGLSVHGVTVGQVSLDLAAMLKRKDGIVSELTKSVAGLLQKNKVTRYTGQARLEGSGRVVVEGGDSLELQAKHILVATGSKPAKLPGVEFDGALIGDSTAGLSFDAVPEHLVVIGAGAIGMELGSVWLRLGSKVTVLEYLDRILPGVDGEIAKEAQRVFKKQGFEFRLSVRVTSTRVVDGRCVVEAEGQEPLTCDRVLCVTGRVPNTDGLGLDAVGLAVDKHGRIVVDEHYATNIPGVYAVGDVIAGPMLAHKASEEGVACVEHIATGYGHVNYAAIPSVVYTHPEIASVGQTEEQLTEAGVAYRKGAFLFRASGRAKALGEVEGRVKVLAEAQSDRVLGVHILGPQAGELIAECVMAMEFGASSEDIARTCHAHPTLSEVTKEAALAVANRAIHS